MWSQKKTKKYMRKAICAFLSLFIFTSAFGRDAGSLSTIVQVRPAATLTQSRAMSSFNSTNIKSDSEPVEQQNTSGAPIKASRVAVVRTTTTPVVVKRDNETRGIVERAAVAAPATVVPRGATVQKISIQTKKDSVSNGPSVSVYSGTRKANTTSVAETKETMEAISSLSETCREQYYQCMDGFCNVVDENLGRCSCSKNIYGYSKTEDALKSATSELQDVTYQIQYIGLTPTEIKTLFSQTVAEDALQVNSDSSQLKSDISRIQNMLVDVKSGSATSTNSTSDIDLDLSNLLSFDTDTNSFDLSSLFSTSGTQSITNQRGESLYKSGVARCKAALNKCQSLGVDMSVIINGYDMEIDADCMLYQRKLEDENKAMLATIRNAKTVLQKARLMVVQQKNEYDLRGCISALDSCMQDDFVCGTDYTNCADPTGRYIVGGSVVVGSMPGIVGGAWGADGTAAYAESGLYTAWNYSEKNIYARNPATPYTIPSYISDTMSLNSAKNSKASDISTWLQNKMGYHDDAKGRNVGMCVAVLNRCQKYTYDKDGNYLANNSVVSSWLERAFPKIKKAQDNILAKYAQGCLGEVSACLTKNNFYAIGNSSSSDNPSNTAIRACLPTINTCRSVTLGLTKATVNTDDLDSIYAWLDAGFATSYREECSQSGGTWDNASGCSCPAENHLTNNVARRSCKCNNDYPNRYNGECLTDAEYNCKSTGGTFSDDKCTCSGSLVSIDYKYCKELASVTSLTSCDVKTPENDCNANSRFDDFEWSAGTNGSSSSYGYHGVGVCYAYEDNNVVIDPDNITRITDGASGGNCWCLITQYTESHSSGGEQEDDKWAWAMGTRFQTKNECEAACATVCGSSMKSGNDVAKKMLTKIR